MRRLATGLFSLHLLLVGLVLGGELRVDRGRSYYIANTQWGAGGLPVRPDVEWRLADGLDYDTLGGTGYRNYGGQTLLTQLTNLNTPGLGEGILSWGQSALYFDGVNDKLHINDGAVLDVMTGSISVMAWVCLDGIPSASANIVSKRTGSAISASVGYGLGTNGSSTNIAARVRDIDGDDVTAGGSSGQALVVGRWHFVGFTWDASAKRLDVWRDGTSVANGSNNLVGSLTNVQTFAVGNSSSSVSYPWFGLIDVVYVWSSVLSGSEIEALYSATRPTGVAGKEYPTIQGAVRQANNLGATTIVVAPGDYYETVSVTNDSLTVTALDVANRPYLRGGNLPVTSGVVGIYTNIRTVVSYLNVVGYYAGHGILADSVSDKSLFHHLVLDSCLTGVRLVSDADSDSVMNCTLVGCGLVGSYGVRVVSGDSEPKGLVWMNNIITGCGTGLSKTSGATVLADYNNLWGNGVNYSGLSAGGNDVSVEPFILPGFRTGSGELRAAGHGWHGEEPPVPIGAFDVYFGGGRWFMIPWGRHGW